MTRLIDADDLKKQFGYTDEWYKSRTVNQIIDNAPTVKNPCNDCIELECENHGVVCPHYRADMREGDEE